MLNDLLLGCLAATIAIGGCSAGPGEVIAELQARRAFVTEVEFTTTSSQPSNPPPPVRVSLTDAIAAESVYDATLALPVFPDGTFSCPADFGILYHLVFSSSDGTVMIADVNPNGCGDVRVAGAGSSVVLRSSTSPTYWPALAQGLGIPESEIYTYVTPN
jgi:hypothetical protein